MIAILGTGKMGEALLSGLLSAGHPAAEVLAVARRPERTAELRGKYGVQTPGAAEAAKTADTLVLAVKPQDMGALLDEIAAFVPASPDQLVISVAAGITTAYIASRAHRGRSGGPGDVQYARARESGDERHLRGPVRG